MHWHTGRVARLNSKFLSKQNLKSLRLVINQNPAMKRIAWILNKCFCSPFACGLSFSIMWNKAPYLICLVSSSCMPRALIITAAIWALSSSLRWLRSSSPGSGGEGARDDVAEPARLLVPPLGTGGTGLGCVAALAAGLAALGDPSASGLGGTGWFPVCAEGTGCAGTVGCCAGLGAGGWLVSPPMNDRKKSIVGQ